MSKQPRIPERDVLASVLDYLTRRGIPHWRQNTGRAHYGDRFVQFGVPGISDVLGLIPPDGRLIAVECKGTGGRLSNVQGNFLATVQDAGGVGVVVWPEDWLDVLEQALAEE